MIRKDELIQAARAAAERSHSPYSGFSVGAATEFEAERLYSGTNVENASFGLTVCAERVAVLAAVAAGERRLAAVAVWTPTPEPPLPCGACLQVLAEFAPDPAQVRVYLVGDSAVEETLLSDLLPRPFRLE